MTLLEQTTKAQQLAADPERSIFVMANAGAGKTRVLTNRVARLLLRQIDPQKILCITFTKAAAAEMAERLFETLGEWSLADDDQLRQALIDLEGGAPAPRGENELRQARQLFARALETPGGLKIQTIHSFCESVLRRFPLEAGAPPGFSVIEDREAGQLIDATIDAVARQSVAKGVLEEEFSRLSRRHDEQKLRTFLRKEASSGLKFDSVLSMHDGLAPSLQRLAERLGAGAASDGGDVQRDYLDALDRDALAGARDVLLGGTTTDIKHAGYIQSVLNAADHKTGWTSLNIFFLTEKNTLRRRLITSKPAKAFPGAETFLKDEQRRFVAAAEALRAAEIYHDSAAAYRIIDAVRTRYQKTKLARAQLDFDDLIARTRALLTGHDSSWVRYKLDYGVDHVLVDETQDTSPAQWSVIEALIEDYLAGQGVEHDLRTFFAVGDIKQSIYSFQGADAELFETKELDLGKRLAAYHHHAERGFYDHVNLQMSFRTTPPVLQFVDELFTDEAAAEGLGKDGAPPHFPYRANEAGLVELWPLVPRPETEKPDAWDAPVDALSPESPVAILSNRIAGTIAGWLQHGETLKSLDRPIEPADILILVQTRGPLFHEILRALGREAIPVAGADRLTLTEDAGVEDLVSFAKFCVQPRDDLSLAETLKSPLFAFTDDDLFALAHDRPVRQTLWSAMRDKTDEDTRLGDCVEEIDRARRLALKSGPYAFFSHILETAGPSSGASGRKRLHQRLTPAARDAVDELIRQSLDFESAHPRSLRLFIDWFAATGVEIKREMERGQDAVRIMTVHGAKGLEANVVFLVDAHKPPQKISGFPLSLPVSIAPGARGPDFHVLTGNKAEDCPATQTAREEEKRRSMEEYRRLLYVAATRARDRLYIAGVQLGNEKNPRNKSAGEATWHTLACNAFDRLEEYVEILDEPFFEGADMPARRLSSEQSAPVKKKSDAPAKAVDIAPPSWLRQPAEREAPALHLSPSRLAEDAETEATQAVAPAAASPLSADRYFRGRVLHRMLELLPSVESAARAGAAGDLLARLAPDLPGDEADRWRREVMAVLDDPKFGAVFGPGSRAEVTIAGAPKGARAGVTVSGQIDRLLVEDDRVVVIDYKTNRPPPANVEDTPPAYLAQMAAYRGLLQEIYPGVKIISGLLWTFEARLSILPDDLLDRALARWLAAG